MSAPSLRELQEAFWQAVTVAPAAGAGGAALAVIEGSPTLAPTERLGIYAEMYVYRLLDVLREDFERVATILGDERFEEVGRAYLAAHPSEHPSVRNVGRAFPAFVAARGDAGALADLARLEWARLGVFDAPDPTPLGLEALTAVAPEDWPALRFEPIAALEVLASDWPVHRLWEHPDVPAGPPAPTVLRVWRQGFAVYHAPMEPAEAGAFARLRAGEPFGAICEGFDDAETAAALLLRWIEDGLVARLR